MEVNRTEQKIIISQKERLLVENKLQKIMPRDEHCKNSAGYEIRTLYFDSLSDRCCAEKEEGLKVHEKIRIRIYGTDDSVIKLESKRKDGEHQIKKSMLISREVMEELVRGHYDILLKEDNPQAAYFFEKLSRGMMPKVIIQYQRLSYCLPVNNIRITFDSDIRATESCMDLFKEHLLTYPIFPLDKVILEVKYNNFLFGYIKNALRIVKKSPSSFSKYFSGRMFYRHMV